MTIADDIMNLKTAVETHLDTNGYQEPPSKPWTPGTKIQLQPPATPADLAEAEQLLGHELPTQLRQYWQTTNHSFHASLGEIWPPISATKRTLQGLDAIDASIDYFADHWKHPELTPDGANWVAVSSLGNYAELVISCDIDNNPGPIWKLDFVNSIGYPEILWTRVAPNLSYLLNTLTELTNRGAINTSEHPYSDILLWPNEDNDMALFNSIVTQRGVFPEF